tara:strand:+ start:6360 stop:7259 length:900 start_codon:yes stop_codon:yes gene_type:complete
MNFRKACEILDIDDNKNVDLIQLKQKYKTYALKYHPDKNKCSNSTNKFQEINSAYEYLCNYHENNNDLDEILEQNTSYSDILFTFIKTIIPIDKDTDIFYIIIQKITKVCEGKSVDFLEKIDKDMLIKIHNVIKQNQEVFHINDEYIELIENVINNKTKNDEVIILNPTLQDLFDNNLYRLTIDNNTYVIPLWHHELVYDNNGNDIYVKCNPILPEDVELDENNDIHIYRNFKISDIWGKEDITVNLGDRDYTIRVNKLKLIREQTIILMNSGISYINLKKIYDVSIMTTVFIHISLEM